MGLFERMFDFNRDGKMSTFEKAAGAAFVCSLAGFKELISVIFPICGYAYLIAIPLVAWRFLSVRKKLKQQEFGYEYFC